MTEPPIEWLEPFRQSDYQFFREWATEAWVASGGALKRNVHLPWRLRMAIGKSGFVRRWDGMPRRKLVVCCTGRPDYYAWPFCYTHEIIPVLWDCWPRYWPSLLRFVRKCCVRTIFCTSSQTADFLNGEMCGVNGFRAHWLPEGIKSSIYSMGPRLVDRLNDVMKFGRDANGELLYPTQESLTQGLRDAKIVICRPRCDTNPEHAQGVETLTQRYWEGMLSGALIVGRAPKELIDFCGYDPVVESGSDLDKAIVSVLSHVGDYQELVDRNRAFAERHADWSERIKVIREVLDA